jgi:hypothetical protein
MNMGKVPGKIKEKPCLPWADIFFKLDFFKFRGIRLSPDDMSMENLVELELAGKIEVSEGTCPNAILSTANHTWLDLGASPGCRSGKPATNRLSYGTAFIKLYTKFGKPFITFRYQLLC